MRMVSQKATALAVRWAALNEIDAGVCENLTYKEMGQRFPELAAQRKCDKLNFRYPQ